jgi:hypothetical protein
MPHMIAFLTDATTCGRRDAARSMTSVCLVPRRFDAAFDANTKAWHLLLEDLTATHVITTQWPLPPTIEEHKPMLGALARFHAGWWDDPRLGVPVGTWLDDSAMNQLLLKFAKLYESFADRLGDRLSPDRRDIYERFIASAPHPSRASLRAAISRSFTATPISGLFPSPRRRRRRPALRLG